jgi:hypothetical protein
MPARTPDHDSSNAVVLNNTATNLLAVIHGACKHAELTIGNSTIAFHFLVLGLRFHSIDCGIIRSIHIVQAMAMTLR